MRIREQRIEDVVRNPLDRAMRGGDGSEKCEPSHYVDDLEAAARVRPSGAALFAPPHPASPRPMMLPSHDPNKEGRWPEY